MNGQTLIQELIEAFCVLPGVGQKTAQRMALHILERDRDGGLSLSKALSEAVAKVGNCKSCQTLTELEECEICSATNRDEATLCVVENPSDVIAIEQSQGHRGKYFVLQGHLSPLDGIGPEDIGIPLLLERIANSAIKEVILATSATVEGEATAYYLAERIGQFGVTVSRIAHGIPMGGELEYVDGNTLSRAMNGRYKL